MSVGHLENKQEKNRGFHSLLLFLCNCLTKNQCQFSGLCILIQFCNQEYVNRTLHKHGHDPLNVLNFKKPLCKIQFHGLEVLKTSFFFRLSVSIICIFIHGTVCNFVQTKNECILQLKPYYQLHC